MRRSRSARLAGSAAVATAAMLVLGACGSDSDEEESGSTGGTEQESGGEDTAGDDTGDTGGTGGGEADGGGGLDGTWTTGLEAPYNVLVFAGGTATFMNDNASEVCTGPATGGTLALVCQSGGTEFSAATYTQDGDTVSVSWESGTEESYQRIDDAALENLPGMEDLGDLADLGDLGELGDLGGAEDVQELEELQDSLNN